MTGTPPWGTPQGSTLPPPPLSDTETEPRLPAARPVDRPRREVEEPPSPSYFLLVEQLTGSGESAVWRVDPEPIPAGITRAEARAAAVRLAQTFRPRHPFSPQRRAVFRLNDDTLIVLVEGATKTFHFRVNVTERLC